MNEIVRTCCNLLDAEYEVLADLTKEEVVTYLMGGRGVNREDATEAVEIMGAW